MPPPSLKKSTFRGAMSFGGATLIVRIVSIVGVVFLARLVEPQAFGLVALCYLVLSIVSLLAPLGLGGALIRHRGNPDQASIQVFLVTLGTGLLAFLLVNVFQGAIASLMGEPRVMEILPWVSLLILIEAAARVPEALMERDLKFNRLGIVLIVSEISYFGVAIFFAFAGYGVWSLVYGIIAKAVLGSLLSWILVGYWGWLRWRPWDTPLMRELLAYGLRSLGSRGAYYFYLNADHFVVGRELGATAMGYYTKAFDFTKKTVDHINKVLGTVLFPTYAKIQDDIPRLSRAYFNSLQVISSITIPASIGVFLLAGRIVPVLLGDRWLPMVPILEILALVSLVKPVSSTTSAVFNAVGHPQYNMYAGIVVSVVLVIAMLILLPYGTVGIAYSVVIAHVIGLGFNVYQMTTILPRPTVPMLIAVRPTVIATGCMAAVIALTRSLPVFDAASLHPAVALIALVAIGAGTYVLSLFIFGRSVLAGFFELLPRRKGAAA